MSLPQVGAEPNPAQWCQWYQSQGLGVHIEPEHERIFMPINDFAGAITMPGRLGSRVRGILPGGAPVIAHPRSDSWTFLSGTHDDSATDLDVYAELFRVYVRVAPRGAKVALPSPADSTLRYREWLVQPTGEMPTMRELLAATRQAISEQP